MASSARSEPITSARRTRWSSGTFPRSAAGRAANLLFLATRIGVVTDQVAAALAALESDVRARLGHASSVERDQEPGFLGQLVSIVRRREGALSVTWIELLGELILGAGTYGGRWELDRSLASAELIRQVLDAAIAGRIVEILSLQRSKIIVTLANGSTLEETGSEGLLGIIPIPGWERRGRRVEYKPSLGCQRGGSAPAPPASAQRWPGIMREGRGHPLASSLTA